MYIYVSTKTMCSPGYHHNGFMATHALGYIMYSLHIYYARLAFVRFEHSLCRGSPMTTYIYMMKDKIYRVIHCCVGACRTRCFCKRELYKHL